MGIQLQSSDYSKIKDIVNIIENEDEFEARIAREKNSTIKRYQFERTLDYITAKYDNVDIQEETMDINYKQYRITLHNLNEIKHYCKHGIINSSSIGNNVSMMNKTRRDNIRLTEYDVIIRLNREQDITDSSFIESISNTIKQENNRNVTYRLKKRFSINTNDDMFRYDFTIVKQANSISQLVSINEHYEIEIEYIGSKENIKDTSETLVRQMFGHLSELIKCLDDIEIIIPHYKKIALIKEYIKLGEMGFDSLIPP